MLRLFIAIPTPASILPSLSATREALRESRAEVKWEQTEKLHCTLKFLGDTKEELVTSITDSLSRIATATPPFAVRYAGVGCFPSRRDPRIIWAGMEDNGGQIKTLFEVIETAMSALGFESERRAFHPHVTLGRVKGSRRIGELLETMETITLQSPPVTIQEIELVKSVLKPSGSEYATVAHVALMGDRGIEV